jgi:cytochrome c
MTKFGTIFSILCILTAGSVMAEGHASGDPAAGEKGFNKCKSCHSIIKGDDETIVKGGKTGPNLFGLAGRAAASVDGFKYGDSIKELGETGFVWSEADFIVYVADPTNFLKEKLDDSKARSKMSFKLKKEEDAKDIWAYLVSVSE